MAVSVGRDFLVRGPAAMGDASAGHADIIRESLDGAKPMG